MVGKSEILGVSSMRGQAAGNLNRQRYTGKERYIEPHKTRVAKSRAGNHDYYYSFH